jgi:hypothetical protein
VPALARRLTRTAASRVAVHSAVGCIMDEGDAVVVMHINDRLTKNADTFRNHL